jgi:hypothetical protein
MYDYEKVTDRDRRAHFILQTSEYSSDDKGSVCKSREFYSQRKQWIDDPQSLMHRTFGAERVRD